MGIWKIAKSAFTTLIRRLTAGMGDSQPIRPVPHQGGGAKPRFAVKADRFPLSFLIWIPIIVLGTAFDWNERPFVMAAAAHLGVGIGWLFFK